MKIMPPEIELDHCIVTIPEDHFDDPPGQWTVTTTVDRRQSDEVFQIVNMNLAKSPNMILPLQVITGRNQKGQRFRGHAMLTDIVARERILHLHFVGTGAVTIVEGVHT